MTRRDAAVALIASWPLTLGAVAATSAQKTALGSQQVFDWKAMTPRANATGEVRSVVRRPDGHSGRSSIHAAHHGTLKACEASPRHQHPNEELLIIREGTVEALVAGEHKRIGPGSIIFQASNQLHNIRNVGDTPAVYHVVNWKTAARRTTRAESGVGIGVSPSDRFPASLRPVADFPAAVTPTSSAGQPSQPPTFGNPVPHPRSPTPGFSVWQTPR